MILETTKLHFDAKCKQNRAQDELLGHLDARVEVIDLDLASLEHSRNLSELLTVEARHVLKGSALVAGDYEMVVHGIYGDDVEVWTVKPVLAYFFHLIGNRF